MKPLYLALILPTGIFLLGGCSIVNSSLPTKSTHQSTQGSISNQGSSASDNYSAARQLAWEAAVIVQNPPHPVTTWRRAKHKWQQAIALLKSASNDTITSTQVMEKLPIYQTNYTAINRRLATEQAAANKLQAAQNIAWQAAVAVQNPPHPLTVWQNASCQWQDAIALLGTIPKSTSVFSKSQEKLATYRGNHTTTNRRVETETNALATLKQFSETAVQLNNLMTSRLGTSTENSIGISYQTYNRMVQDMESSLDQFASQAEVKKHLIYLDLAATVESHKLALKLWKSYLDFKRGESQPLDANSPSQLFPISLQESNQLIQKYGVRTYGNGTQISLKFTLWSIWQQANQHIRQAQQKILSLR